MQKGEIEGINSLCLAMQDQLQIESKGLQIDSFELQCVLGKGAYAKVLLVQKRDTGQLFAMKVLKKSKIIQKQQVLHVQAERSVMAEISHPFIIKLIYAFQSPSHLYFCLEYCPGGELYFLLSRQRRFNEEYAKFYGAQVLMALEFLHSRHIIYRDLKPENILICRDGYIKLTDFGMCKKGINNLSKGAESICGTMEYMAPEMIKGKQYGQAIDWWAFGCFLYEMVVGQPPFYAQKQNELQDKIVNEELHIPNRISIPLQDLLQQLLTKNPFERLTKNVGSHQWFTLDFDALFQKQLSPPFLPKLNNELDLSCFDPQFIKQRINSYESQLEECDSYKDFTYGCSDKQMQSFQTLSPEIIDQIDEVQETHSMKKVHSTEMIYQNEIGKIF